MILKKTEVGVYSANCYIIADEQSREGIIIDPGGDADKIMKFVKDNKLLIKYIVLTHAHGDHIGGVNEVLSETDAVLCVHKDDLFILKDRKKNFTSQMRGPIVEIRDAKLLEDGDVLQVGDMSFKIIHTPGHSPGGICIYIKDVLFTGDTLFANNIGRGDLIGGDEAQLIRSIKARLMELPDATTAYPGHGPATRIGIERMTNPYLK
ncbi:MAG: MBL fold metallo-hydrolase [Alkaliphilus sp.]|nr:MBL fold metallo-hydrolase [bacterium AH-315-E09]PHS36233.1 MAG: MBL fold metallo-hydrolase [Alkaliphilus sp.]